jgi:hypothetical protein
MLRSAMKRPPYIAKLPPLWRFRVAVWACALSSMLGAGVLQGAESWQVSTRIDSSTGAEISSAVARNDAGYRLIVERGSLSSPGRCSFKLPESSEAALDSSMLPTMIVDGLPPQTVVRWPPSEIDATETGDLMEASRRVLGAAPLLGANAHTVAFVCWKKLKDQASPTAGTLRQLLDGEQVTVQFHLVGDVAEETTFSLEAASEAITEVLGISPEPSERDLVQEELLRFRVHYLRTACYWFQGTKRQKRCVEAVRKCAQKSYDSVVSMLGCIEGN